MISAGLCSFSPGALDPLPGSHGHWHNPILCGCKTKVLFSWKLYTGDYFYLLGLTSGPCHVTSSIELLTTGEFTCSRAAAWESLWPHGGPQAFLRGIIWLGEAKLIFFYLHLQNSFGHITWYNPKTDLSSYSKILPTFKGWDYIGISVIEDHCIILPTRPKESSSKLTMLLRMPQYPQFGTWFAHPMPPPILFN